MFSISGASHNEDAIADSCCRCDAAHGSLNDARSAITKGTGPGIVIIGAKRRPVEASAAAPAAAAATPLAEGVGAAVRWGDPPSGQPLKAANLIYEKIAALLQER